MGNVVDFANGSPQRRKPPPPRTDESRPLVRLDVDVHRVVDECAAILGHDVSLFQRDGQLAHVIRTAESEADALTLAGTPQIRAVQPASLIERLTRIADFQRFDKRSGEWVPALPGGALVPALAARGQWRAVRPLVGVIEAPSLRPDGTVLQTPGYDRATGFLYSPNATFALVPDAPTRDDAVRALRSLEDVFVDFPFATKAHLSAAIACLLTVLARPGITGSVPGLLVDATTRGTGKTLTADVITTIATGRPTSKMGYPVNDEELEKILGAYALRGALVINFDNVTRSFGGGPIDRCLTAGGSVELRVLGKSEVPSLPWRAVVLATGNNVEVHGDTARRVLVCRMESNLENPEDRTGFAHHPLLPWVEKQRCELVVAALTVLRAYVAAGKPDMRVGSWGSFEAWSALIPGALVWAGAANPMATRPSGDAVVEPEKIALVALLSGWQRLSGGHGMTAKAALDALYPSSGKNHGPPDGFDDLREAIELLTKAKAGMAPNVSGLGYLLRKSRGRVVGGRKLVGNPDRKDVMQWEVVRQGAGDAGDAGDVPLTPREDVSANSQSVEGNITSIPRIPRSDGGAS